MSTKVKRNGEAHSPSAGRVWPFGQDQQAHVTDMDKPNHRVVKKNSHFSRQTIDTCVGLMMVEVTWCWLSVGNYSCYVMAYEGCQVDLVIRRSGDRWLRVVGEFFLVMYTCRFM
ncbi:hypothetical protein GWI33_020638 [Rhynchophorus ferrugineus]|uniref:Uncharacterized protein n=1 Tax=Rhynchophorus ferrugineus TaxID=354439 RepID=A0A834HNZ4_RHYFE|nr:hypothetical protein GWI33_020638 [Rhynchophorus ferrugineus]